MSIAFLVGSIFLIIALVSSDRRHKNEIEKNNLRKQIAFEKQLRHSPDLAESLKFGLSIRSMLMSRNKSIRMGFDKETELHCNLEDDEYEFRISFFVTHKGFYMLYECISKLNSSKTLYLNDKTFNKEKNETKIMKDIVDYINEFNASNKIHMRLSYLRYER